MMQFERLSFGIRMDYGLGLINFDQTVHGKSDDYSFIGHPGVDLASQTHTSGFFLKHRFSLAVLESSVQGMNCTSPGTLGKGLGSADETEAAVLEAILNLHRGQAFVSSGPWHRRPESSAASLPLQAFEMAGTATHGLFDHRCDYQEDVRLDLNTNGSCFTFASTGVAQAGSYRVTRVAKFSFSMTVWSNDDKCRGSTLSNMTMPLELCLPLPAEARSTLPYSPAMRFTHDEEAGVVSERLYFAAGVTQGCRWHRVYGDKSSLHAGVLEQAAFLV